MKRNFFAGCMGILITLIMATPTRAQLAFTNVRPPKDLVPYARIITKDESFSSYRNNISTSAVRDFMEKFENVSNETWYNAEDRFVVMFKLDDVDYRIDYDSQGNCIQTIHSYAETKLPNDVRDMIRSSYRLSALSHIPRARGRNASSSYQLFHPPGWKRENNQSQDL